MIFLLDDYILIDSVEITIEPSIKLNRLSAASEKDKNINRSFFNCSLSAISASFSVKFYSLPGHCLDLIMVSIKMSRISSFSIYG